MDNEADDLELRRLLKAMESSREEGAVSAQAGELDDLKAKWQRYHVISASLKQEIHTSPSRSLLAGIQAELADEPAPVMEKPAQQAGHGVNGVNKATGRSVLQMLGQGAIAASMTLAVLFTADMVMVADKDVDGNNGAAVQVADNATPTVRFNGQLNPNTETRVAIQSDLDEEEFNRLERVVSEELQDAIERPEVPATFNPAENR